MRLLAAQTGTIEHVRSQFDCTVSHEFVGDGLSVAKKSFSKKTCTTRNTFFFFFFFDHIILCLE